MFPQANIDLFHHMPETDEELISNFLPSKLWRLNNLYTIVDKLGKKRKFILNRSQFKTYSSKLQHPRIIILKSRQQGISTLFLIDFFDDLITLPDLSVGMMAQDKPAAQKLLERVKVLHDGLHPAIIAFLNLEKVKDNTEEIGYSNGSTMYIRTSFRSTTLQRLHVSEYGKIAKMYPEKIAELKAGTLQAIAQGNTVVIESTAEGKNDFKLQWDKATRVQNITPLDFKPVFLSWMEDPDCVLGFEKPIPEWAIKYFDDLEVHLTNEQKWFWIAKWEELQESSVSSDIYQEYPSTPDEAFKVDVEGSYYSKQRLAMLKSNRIGRVDYVPNQKVIVSFDIGVDDYTAMIFAQVINDECYIIDEYASNNEGLEHYLDIMTALTQRKGYSYGEIFMPHDVEVREWSSGKTRLEKLRSYGIKPRVIKRTAIADGIEAVRQLLPKSRISSSCTGLLDAIQNYRKQYDQKLQMYLDKPLHDEHSHFADSLRYLALGIIRYINFNSTEVIKDGIKYDKAKGEYPPIYEARYQSKVSGFDI